MQLTGIHHLTAVSAAIKENHRFYTQTLGMRLVKRSVNQDDVGAYHLFYADAKGTPGTDLTFFDWPVSRERRGTRSIVRTCLRVKGEDALEWWIQRFDELKVSHGEIFERDGLFQCECPLLRGQKWPSGSMGWPQLPQMGRPCRTTSRAYLLRARNCERVAQKRAAAPSHWPRGTLSINFGFWDTVRSREPREPGFVNRKIERKTEALGGIKSLYSDSYFGEDEFWSIYNRPAYEALKERYDPRRALGDLYAKCVLRR